MHHFCLRREKGTSYLISDRSQSGKFEDVLAGCAPHGEVAYRRALANGQRWLITLASRGSVAAFQQGFRNANIDTCVVLNETEQVFCFVSFVFDGSASSSVSLLCSLLNFCPFSRVHSSPPVTRSEKFRHQFRCPPTLTSCTISVSLQAVHLMVAMAMSLLRQ